MNNTQASPASENRGGQTKRIVLTRGELVKILWRFLDEVKEAKEFPLFIDSIMAEAEQDSAIEFDAAAPAGERLLHGSEGRS